MTQATSATRTNGNLPGENRRRRQGVPPKPTLAVRLLARGFQDLRMERGTQNLIAKLDFFFSSAHTYIRM